MFAVSIALVLGATAAYASPATSSEATAPSAGPAAHYPLHTNIVATTFWVGEMFDPTLADGSQVCSTYDSQWAFHWSGISLGRVPRNASGCAGAQYGGCDGPARTCLTRPQLARSRHVAEFVPRSRENTYYLDLPYDDLNDPIGFRRRCDVVPWAGAPGYAGHCADRRFSDLKNRWVEITGPNRRTCYGQIQDAGPSHGNLYHDARYVFGADDARPRQQHFNNAGLDVSPALNRCLGFADPDGDHDQVDWRFVDDLDVPTGPWLRTVTASGVTN